jgi:MFS family permease
VIDTRLRARSAVALFLGVAASGMGYTMMVAVLPLSAEDLLGSPRWSGVPSALSTTGVAVGSVWLATLIARRGRRSALALSYTVATVAACVAAIGAGTGAFVLLAAAIFLLGAGYSANRLSRYAAADLYEPHRRSAAIGWNVWAATIGSVVGPLLLASTERASAAIGIPTASGPFLVAAVAFAVSGLVLRLLYGSSMAVDARHATGGRTDDARVSAAGVRLAAVALVVSQAVMVLIMTMTPVHIRHGGHGLDTVGVVFASHTFGMFAFSPAAGLLSDRVGRLPMIVLACFVLATAGVMAAESDPGSTPHATALFLLGLGWCFGFVAASALLTESAAPTLRLRLQGVVDSWVWGSAAAAGLASGVLLSAAGYARLGYVGAVVALVPLLFVRRGSGASRWVPGRMEGGTGG